MSKKNKSKKNDRGARIQDNILAHGEVTGHFHQAVGNAALFAGVAGAPGVLDVTGPTAIQHQEHKPIDLNQTGELDVLRVLETDHVTEEMKVVTD